MSIQDEANKLFEQARKEQERVENLTSNIIGEKEASITQLIRKAEEEKQRIAEQTNRIVNAGKQELDALINQQIQNYTEEELAYVNSPNYANYQYILENLDPVLNFNFSQLIKFYQDNMTFYHDAFYRPLMSAFQIQGIGFPIPERFVEELKQIILKKIEQMGSLEEAVFDVDIVPCEYRSNKGNDFIKI